MADGATGAELQAICREAGMMAVRRDAPSVEMKDFAGCRQESQDRHEHRHPNVYLIP